MRVGRKRDDAWTLRPDDLPVRESLQGEALLLGLEDNAVFRSMIFGRRTRRSMPRFESGTGLFVMLFTSFILISCFGPLFFFVAFPLRQFFRKPQANVVAFFGMPEVLLRELVDLRVDSEVWTAALWGRAISRRHRRTVFWTTAIWIALVVVYAFWVMPKDLNLFWASVHAAVALMVGLWLSTTLCSYLQPPYAPLPTLKRRVQRFRRATALSNNPLGWLYTLALLIGIQMIIVLLTIMLMVAATMLMRVAPGAFDVLPPQVWFHPFSAVLLPLGFGLVLGAIFAWVRARAARRNAGRHLGEIDDEVEAMLAIMRSRLDYEGDEQAEVPQLHFEPLGGRPGDGLSGSGMSDGAGGTFSGSAMTQEIAGGEAGPPPGSGETVVKDMTE